MQEDFDLLYTEESEDSLSIVMDLYMTAYAHKCPITQHNIQRSTPERNLLAAILIRAIRDLVNTDKRIQKEAASWILSTNTDIGSFIWVTENLDIAAISLQKLTRCSKSNATHIKNSSKSSLIKLLDGLA